MNLGHSKLARRAILPVIILVAVAVYFFHRSSAGTRYITAEITRGPIVRSVIATGMVNPVTTVQVGTFDSGPIQAIYADFNSPVKAGQLIAKIDPRPFQVKVDEAGASLANAKAQLIKDQADEAYKKITSERDEQLSKAEAVSQDVRDSARSVYQQAVAQVALDRANIEQQAASLAAAQINLNYTSIISPVDGTIVSRNVDVGQTVAASFQTPTLFLIAKDLTQMQVDTNVSESDIGDIHKGTTAEFKVDAFPDREFDGTVTQVRQAPITVQNVVTYDVVVTVANPELLLKPGMTANVTIVTAKRDDVLRVPLEALRFTPRQRKEGEAVVSPPRGRVSRQSQVWVEKGKILAPVRLVTGLDDGSNVEVISGDLKPDDTVVTGVIQAQSGDHGGGSPLTPRFPH